MPLSFASPLSLYSIPVVWFVGFYPMTLKYLLIDKTLGYNNVQPRANTNRMKDDKSISPAIAARAERLEGAHLNGTENFPLWAAAILAGNQAGLENRTLNTVAIAYIGLRLAYNYVYINHTTAFRSWLRSSLFFSGLSLPLYLLFKSASTVARL